MPVTLIGKNTKNKHGKPLLLRLIFYYCIKPLTFLSEIMSKQLYTLEYPVRCSPGILYEFLATPAGLSEWFADKVDERDGIIYFGWNGSYEKAELLEQEEDKYVRYHWMNAPKEEFFEFRIEKSEITNQTILIVKDFAEKKEIKDQSRLWDYQVKDLFHRLGS
jgi:hypothetical protein